MSTIIIRILRMIQFNVRNSTPGIYCESEFMQIRVFIVLIWFSEGQWLKPTSNLRGLPTSLTTYTCTVFINRAIDLYTIPGKNSYTCTFYLGTLGATCIGHNSTRHVHNLMKSQLYTYLGRRMLGTAFVGCRGWWAMHAIRGKSTTCMHSGSLVWAPNSPVNLGKECLILPDTAFISYRVQLGLYTVSILGNTNYTLIRLWNHAFRILCRIIRILCFAVFTLCHPTIL